MYGVEDVMVSKVVTIKANATVSEAAKLMSRHSIGSLVVVPEGTSHMHLNDVGLITERDIMTRVVARDLPTNMGVCEVFTSPPPSVEAGTGISEVFELMRERNLRWLVVSRAGLVVGIVSLRDLTNSVRFSSARRLLGVHEREHFRVG
jgi:CBS domain-containing protein